MMISVCETMLIRVSSFPTASAIITCNTSGNSLIEVRLTTAFRRAAFAISVRLCAALRSAGVCVVAFRVDFTGRIELPESDAVVFWVRGVRFLGVVVAFFATIVVTLPELVFVNSHEQSSGANAGAVCLSTAD